ncbi:MAG TPA: NAD(P)-dependent oxidoreductase [Chitinophagaceae bacterium]|nr:NAD(P)-dependent oxidoreductase [Chitinophagaceae bacterium]
MLKIGLIREGKIPSDNRVALTPDQCKWLNESGVAEVVVQYSAHRCFPDKEYIGAGVQVTEDVSGCDVLVGIKEVPVQDLVPRKTYLFFSHTKKEQPHNRKLLQAIIEKEITLIDFECMEHEDGQRIIGFGFFAGIVGAHNGMMAYGRRTNSFSLERVYQQKDFRSLIHSYFGLKLPNIKVAVTGSGRVAHGVTEVLNLMGLIEVEKEEFVDKEFTYPVYVQLKGSDLYTHKEKGTYNRDHFHQSPELYRSKFGPYLNKADILMNGVYWDKNMPRLFEREEIQSRDFRISVIADITDDPFGSVPINLEDGTIENPVYGVDRNDFRKTAPHLPHSIDIMAVGNLPNELPKDASRYFGEQLIKHILPDLISGQHSRVIEKATIVKRGQLSTDYEYLRNYAQGL